MESFRSTSVLEQFELMKAKEPKVTIFRCIKEGSFNIFFGPPKSGKTTVLELLLYHLVLGIDNFMGHDLPGDSRKVLMISLEESWYERTDRNRKIVQERFNTIQDKTLFNNFHTVPEDFPRYIETNEDWNALEFVINNSEAKIVVIDSLSRFTGGEIEKSKDAQKILKRLRELQKKLQITLFLIHHSTKFSKGP